MRTFDNQNEKGSEPGLDGLAARLALGILHSGVNQSEFARRIGVSAGFVSDVVRGNKKPGAEFLSAVRTQFGISIDWLLTGEGTMAGANGIDLVLLRTIRLQIAVARSAVIESNPAAKALLLLIRDGRLEEAVSEPGIKEFLDEIAPPNSDDELAVQLYNGQQWSQDPDTRYRNLLGAAIAYFEANKPIDKLSALARASGVSIQINVGSSQRNAGRDFYG